MHIRQADSNSASENFDILVSEQAIREMKEMVKQVATAKPKTYAQAVTANLEQAHFAVAKKERIEQARREKAKQEVTLTFRNASEDVHQKLECTKESDFAAQLQKAIREQAGLPTVTIRRVKKLPGKIVKIYCETEDDATKLRALDWEKSHQGAAMVKEEYGVVVHGVPKEMIDVATQSQEEMKR